MKFFWISLLLCAALSCSDNDNNGFFCGADNPIEGLEWLSEEIERRETSTSDDVKYCYIVQHQLVIKTVFTYEDCNPAINKAIFVLDCEGQNIGTVGVDISTDDLKNSCVIWRPENFACLLDFACIQEN